MRARLALLAAVLLLGAGCNNPFDPKADVELVELDPTEITVYASTLPSGGLPLPLGLWQAEAFFIIKNKVGVNLTGVDITYTDLNGNQVTAYKDTGGRHYKFAYRLSPVTNNDQFGYGEGLESAFGFYVVDKNVIDELKSPAYPSNGYMFADIVFRGEDDNGHDVKLTGRMTIKFY